MSDVAVNTVLYLTEADLRRLPSPLPLGLLLFCGN